VCGQIALLGSSLMDATGYVLAPAHKRGVGHRLSKGLVEGGQCQPPQFSEAPESCFSFVGSVRIRHVL